MGLTKCRIGDCVEVYNQACGISNLTVDDVSGVNRDKEFFEPSKQVGGDTSKYKIEQNRCAMACQGCGAVFLLL